MGFEQGKPRRCFSFSFRVGVEDGLGESEPGPTTSPEQTDSILTLSPNERAPPVLEMFKVYVLGQEVAEPVFGVVQSFPLNLRLNSVLPGLNGVDNGILIFDKVRIPRENMLDK